MALEIICEVDEGVIQYSDHSVDSTMESMSAGRRCGCCSLVRVSMRDWLCANSSALVLPLEIHSCLMVFRYEIR